MTRFAMLAALCAAIASVFQTGGAEASRDRYGAEICMMVLPAPETARRGVGRVIAGLRAEIGARGLARAEFQAEFHQIAFDVERRGPEAVVTVPTRAPASLVETAPTVVASDAASDAAPDVTRAALCAPSESRYLMRGLQEALSTRGFDPGPFDGVYGPSTKAALIAYQRARRLAVGAVTLETLQALDLDPRTSGVAAS